MGKKLEAVNTGINVTLKLVTTALWVAVTIAAFSLGSPIFGVVGIVYLVYLWVFGGRLLIY
jgi:hypothetical protein